MELLRDAQTLGSLPRTEGGSWKLAFFDQKSARKESGVFLGVCVCVCARFFFLTLVRCMQ